MQFTTGAAAIPLITKHTVASGRVAAMTRHVASMAAVFAVAVACWLGSSVEGFSQQRGELVRQPRPADVGDFSVIRQDWRQYPGLAVANITFNNANGYEVRNAVISCDFVDKDGKVIITRGTTIFQTFPPGSTIKIDDVHFTLREKSATPGSCRVVSVRSLTAP